MTKTARRSNDTMKAYAPRIVVTTAAFMAVIARLVWPTLRIDAVTIGLLVLAALPWLSSVIKSIEVVGVGRLELQDLESRLEYIKGAAESADAKVETVLATASSSRQRSEGQAALTEIEQLRSRYNALREVTARGIDRTEQMTKLVSRAIELAPTIDRAGLAVLHRIAAEDGGNRVIGYAFAFAQPESALVDPLLSALSREEQPFAQYWAILALRRALELTDDPTILRTAAHTLRLVHANIPPGTSRDFELNRLLKQLDRRAGQESFVS